VKAKSKSFTPCFIYIICFGWFCFNQDRTSDFSEFFGVDMVEQPIVEDLGIPYFVEKCVSVIEAAGLQSVGVYRLSGNAGIISDLKDKIDQGFIISFFLLNFLLTSSWQTSAK